MKITKTLLFMVCMIAGLTPLQAQFWQHSYGDVAPPGDMDRVNDGRRVFNVIDGMMTTGTNQQWAGPGVPRWADVFVTNIKGSVGIPNTIALGYGVQDVGGVTLYPYSCFGTEIHANQYAIAGVCDKTPGQYREIFYARLSANGTILSNNTFSLGASYDRYVIRDMVPDRTGDFVYVVGEVWDNAANLNHIFAMKIKYTGGLDWSQIYDISPSSTYDDYAWDAVEVPSTGELAIVGSTIDPVTALQSGYIMMVDGASGNSLGSFPDIVLFSHNSGPVELTSVVLSNDWSFPSGFGFVMAGQSGAGIGDAVAFGIDYSLAPGSGFGNSFVGPSGVNSSSVYDITTRLNLFGSYEYYVAGTTTAGGLGGTDIEVFKLDNTLNASAQFVFGSAGNDGARAVDVGNGSTGLTTFGERDATGTSWDLMMTQSYYNGVLPTGCASLVSGCANTSAPGITTLPMVSPLGPTFGPTNGSLWIQAQLHDNQWCYANTVAGGSNWKTSGFEITDVVHVSGNPTDGYHMELGIVGNEEKALEISITDMMGRVVWTRSEQVQPGERELRLPDGSGWSAGMYQVKWTLNDQSGAEKIIVH